MPRADATMPAMILSGGLGTRFRSVRDDIPKCMADIHGKPFLSLLIEYLVAQGIPRIILCVGYQADIIINHYRHSPWSRLLTFSREKTPLGTAGAVRHATSLLNGEHFFVLNGDSYCAVNLTELSRAHQHHPAALATLAVVMEDTRTDTGFLRLDPPTHTITSFHEKKPLRNAPFINAGVYLFHRRMLASIPQKTPCSLERDLFHSLAGRGLYGFPVAADLIDIGTPERYTKALEYFKSQMNTLSVSPPKKGGN